MIVLDRPILPNSEKTINLPLAFCLSCSKRHHLVPLKVLTQIGSPLEEQNRTISTTNHLYSYLLSLIKVLLLLVSITQNGKAPPSPPKNSKNFPSTLTEAYITSTRRRAHSPDPETPTERRKTTGKTSARNTTQRRS